MMLITEGFAFKSRGVVTGVATASGHRGTAPLVTGPAAMAGVTPSALWIIKIVNY